MALSMPGADAQPPSQQACTCPRDVFAVMNCLVTTALSHPDSTIKRGLDSLPLHPASSVLLGIKFLTIHPLSFHPREIAPSAVDTVLRHLQHYRC